MKVLIAILSCRRHSLLESTQRRIMQWQIENWRLPHGAEFDLRYFIGSIHQKTSDPSHVHLPVGDHVEALPFKSQMMMRWALDRDYQYVYRGDTDCYIHLPRLLKTVPKDLDYTGYYRTDPKEYGNYASGGSGYWVSRRSMEIIQDCPLQPDYFVKKRS